MADVRTGTDATIIAVPPPLSTTGSGTEATAQRVTIATDSTGVLSVDDNGASLTVDQATAASLNATVVGTGTFAVQIDAAALTSLALIDDMIYVDDTATHATGTSKGALIMAAAVPTDTSVSANDIGALAMTTARALHVSVQEAIPAGTNNIGDVDVLSLPALAAGTNLIGRTASSDETSTIYAGTTALTPKFAIIDAASSGDNTLVASVASKKIRVHQLFMVASGTVTARFESGAAGTALTGQMNLVANSGFTLPYSPIGWFETAITTLLNLELSGAVSVDGALVYTEV